MGNNEAVFEYKCRRCRRVYDEWRTGATAALMWLTNAVRTTGLEPEVGQAPQSLSLHPCDDKGYGVSDLIGYRIGERE